MRTKLRFALVLTLVSASGAATAENPARDYANSLIEECRTTPQRMNSQSFDPFSSFAVLSATPESMAQQELFSCIARKYVADAKFASGYFALLAELPAEQARAMHDSVSKHIQAQVFSVDPLGPWQLATNGCKLIDDSSERVACFEAVLGSVPSRLH